LRPGGLLATFSCSGGISRELFQKIVAGAAADAAVDAQILHRFEAACDHPVGIHFPEGEYLKGLLCRRQDLSAMARPPGTPRCVSRATSTVP
jgi:23S rRNA (cytosine1962-C5)-methyltransferase